MRRLRLALVALSVLLAAALLAAWLVPPQLDWVRYRGTIAQLASTRLDLPVTIDGPVTLRLLPQPVLTADRVSVGDPATDGMLIRVPALRMRLALWPLLAGRIDARQLVLHRPDLHIPWPARPGTLSATPPVWLSAVAATVEDGRLSVGQFAVTGISGTLSSRAGGALQAAVTADIAGQHWQIAAQLDGPDADGAAGLSVDLQGQGRAEGTAANFTGRFAASGQLDGRIRAAGPDLSLLLPTPKLRFQAQGRLTVAQGLAEADELKVTLDGAPAAGAVALRVLPQPRVDVALSAARLNLDPWLPMLLTQPAAQRSLPVGLDFSADAATLAGATLRHLRATFELLPSAVTVQEAAADLPGSASVRLAGRIVRTDGAAPAFIGKARLQAAVLRTTLHWLLPHATAAIAALPAEVAQQARLTARLRLQPDRIALSDIQGRFDDTALTGSLDWNPGKPPAIAMDLRLDRMRLGPWIDAAGATGGLRQLLLGRLDTDLRLAVQHASFAGLPIGGLLLHVATLDGGVKLQRLQGSVLGAQFAAQGAIGPQGDVTGVKLRLTTANALQLVDQLPLPWRGTPALWLGPAQLEVTAAGPEKAVAADMRLDLGDLHLRLMPVLNLQAGTLAGSVTAQDPNALTLIEALGLPAQLGLDTAPDWLGPGSMSLVAQLGIGPGRQLRLDNGEFVAGRLRTRLQLALDLRGAEPALSGSLAAETLPLPPIASGPLPLALLDGWQAKLQVTADRLLSRGDTLLHDAAATVQLQQGVLSLDHVTGQLSGGSLAGDARLDGGAKPAALSLQAKLIGAHVTAPVLNLPTDLTAGQADLSLSLHAAGYSAAALVAGLSGSVQVSVRDGAVSGFDLGGLHDLLQQSETIPSDAALRPLLNGGNTAFRQLTLQGTLARGILSLDKAELAGPAGTARAAGTVALVDDTAGLRIELRPALPGAPGVAVLVSGGLASPQRTPELAGLAGWHRATQK